MEFFGGEVALKFSSIEHEIIFNKLKSALDYEESPKPINQDTVPGSPTGYMSEIDGYLKEMSKTRENYAYRYVGSSRKIVGKSIVFVKKVIRKLLKWYIEPITLQQTRFNNAVTPAIGRSTELLGQLLTRVSQMEEEMKQLIDNNQMQYQDLEQQLEHKQEQIDILSTNVEQIDILSTNVEQIKYQNDILERSHTRHLEIIDIAVTKINKLEDNVEDVQFEIYNKNTYSQSGEDSILAYIIYVLGIPFETVDYIDLGANHAKEMSNTYYFYSRGAKGILVEANPNLIPELNFYRQRDVVLNNCIDVETGKIVDFYILSGDGLSTPDHNKAIEYCEINPALQIVDKKSVETISYSSIVEQYLGKAPTILSIDIEGYDVEILHSIDYAKYRPLLIVIEMINYNVELNFKSKNLDVIKYLNSKDYDEYAFTGINSIFLDRRYLEGKGEIER
jgi:FkbM family methyltransferase